jgi:hypothetical protein
VAKYKLLQRSFIDNNLYQPGAVVTVRDDLIPGPHMVPVDEKAKQMARQIGLVNEIVPDFVDELTGGPDVTKYGASPQGMTGIAAATADGEIPAEIPGQGPPRKRI